MKIHEERRPEKYSIHALSKEELSQLEENIRTAWKLAAIIWCRTGDIKDLYNKAAVFTDLVVDYLCIEDLMFDLKSYLESFEEEYTLVRREEYTLVRRDEEIND